MTEDMIVKIKIWIPIITGFGGVILGALLGWFFNWISQRGKISISIDSWKEKFYKSGSMGDLIITDKYNEDFQYFEYKIKMFLHNSSDKTRFIRNIRIVFKEKNRILYEDIPKDASTTRQYAGGWHSDEVGIINIQAKNGIEKNITGYISKDNINLIKKADNVLLYYLELKKTKKIYIKKVDYSEFFTEEAKNTKFVDEEGKHND